MILLRLLIGNAKEKNQQFFFFDNIDDVLVSYSLPNPDECLVFELDEKLTEELKAGNIEKIKEERKREAMLRTKEGRDRIEYERLRKIFE